MDHEYYRVFRAFADKNRLKILEMLCQGELCACVLLRELDISQPTLSHHMKILCESGLVKSYSVGPWKHYLINRDGCDYASRLLNALRDGDMQGMLRFSRAALWVSAPVRRLVARCRRTELRPDTAGQGCCTEQN